VSESMSAMSASLLTLRKTLNACMRSPLVRAIVLGANALAFLYLCAGELLPLPVREASPLLQNWALQQVWLLATCSCLAVLLSWSGGVGSVPGERWLLPMVNVLPVVASLVVTFWSPLSENCPPSEYAVDEGCDYVAFLLDVVGLITARLARLDLGLCLLFVARELPLMLAASGGELGYAEAIPIHRSAGWWCAIQSALHSVAYLVFYFRVAGLPGLLLYCLPTPLQQPDQGSQINSLGLVNGLGVLAFIVMGPLVVPAWPQVRRRCYHVFQRGHVVIAAIFVVGCALHDLPVLLFAVPGVAVWYFEWRGRGGGGCCAPRMPATARLLPGTTWVELKVACGENRCLRASKLTAPRGQFVSLRVVPLGPESHPLSICLPAAHSATELSVLVSSRAGDWSRGLAALSQQSESSFEVEVAGPFPTGGGEWSLSGEDSYCCRGQEPALLLLAGGTGVTGWLPGLAAARATGRPCHLVWCVQSEADYLSLADRLPLSSRGVDITVFVTRAAADAPLTPLPSQGGGEMAETRQPQQAPASSSSTLEWLAAALVGLAVGHWGWKYLVDVLGLTSGWAHTSLIGYTVLRRCLPIVLIVASMVGSMAVCRCAVERMRTAVRRRRCCATAPTCTEELGAVRPQQPQAPLFTGVSSTAQVRLEGDVTGAPAGADVESRLKRSVRPGRPDLDALLRTAAAAAAQSQAIRLVVAACGPPALVEAARRAVAAARKGKQISGVRLEFTGTDPRW
jgi:NAD(P)H-flavin reductase